MYPNEDPQDVSSVISSTSQYGGRRRKIIATVAKRGTVNRPTTACRVNKNTLHPLKGQLRCRLNKKIGHLPENDVERIRSKVIIAPMGRYNSPSKERYDGLF